MKVKLLRRIKRCGANQINIRSITKEGGDIVGMSYGFTDDCYHGLFDFGDTKNDVIRKAQHIYWEQVKDYYRKKLKSIKQES
ncbi:MAG: hypothetical protein ABI237_05990 [Ginsengibacter sp.]